MKQTKSYGGWLIETSGLRTATYPKNMRKFTFQELYALLGCNTLELVVISPTTQLWIDEDGAMKKGRVKNLSASYIAQSPVYGKAFFCQKGLVQE